MFGLVQAVYAYAVPDYATLWQFGFTGIVCFDFKR